MVTNNYDFKTITRLRMLCMKVLPTVYGDALSYEEQVCKVTEKINQLVDTVNELPDYIIEVVKELIENAGLENIVKQVLADMYFINVKNPPAPYVAAKGDGTTNDTDAIQALINYAALQRSYLFFPAGNYLVNGLTMVENVSLVGLDRYSTIITLAPNINHDLITGFVENATMSNLTLNANMNGQTANCSCLNATVENALIDFMIFKNGYDSVVIENTNEFEGAYWMFDGIQHNALTLNGDGAVISNVIFKNASQLSSNALAVINGNNKISGIFSNTAIPNGVIIAASGASVEGTILNATKTITGGSGNYINVEDLMGVNKYATNDTETFTGTKTTTATSKVENYSGNRTLKATNDTETLSGAKTINANEIILNPTQPLEYQKAELILNDYFNGIPIKDADKETVLLTPGAMDIVQRVDNIQYSGGTLPYYGCFFEPWCRSDYYPQGTCLIDDETMVSFFSNMSNDNSAVIRKVNLTNGEVILESLVQNAYHGNALAYIPETKEIYTVRFYNTGSTGMSNQIIVFSPDTLTITRTFSITGLESISMISYSNGKLYVVDRNTYPTLYECNIDGSGLTKKFTFNYRLGWMNFVDSKLNVWVTNGYNGIVLYDIEGNLISTFGISQFSEDYMTKHIEMESIMEFSDGTIAFTDVAYKRNSEGIPRRHIINTFRDKRIINGQFFTPEMIQFNRLYVADTYNPIQGGSAGWPYDSLEYGLMMTDAYKANLVIVATPDDAGVDQWAVVRVKNKIHLYRVANGGLVVDGSTILLESNISNKYASEVAAYINLSYPVCLAAWRFANVHLPGSSAHIDGGNTPNIVGVYDGYQCSVTVSGGGIINCEVPRAGKWNRQVTFGGYINDYSEAAIDNSYRAEQPGSYLYTRCGGVYGMKTKTLTGVTFANFTTQTFNAKNFFGNMLSMCINNETFVWDMNQSKTCSFTTLVGEALAYVKFTVTITNNNAGLTFAIGSVSKFPTTLDLAQLSITKISLW